MSLLGLPLSPGAASGRLCGIDSRPCSGPEPSDIILTVDGVSWPLVTALPSGVRRVVVVGPPAKNVPYDGLPAVAGFDRDLLREGEVVQLDGRAGTLTIDGVKETHVVTAFLERPDGRILLLLRSERVGTFRGRWAGVSGFLEDTTPLAQARREVHEETGLGPERLELADEGAPILVRESSTVFIVHPFRFLVSAPELRLDWEHVTAEWVDPKEIARRPTVPKLDRAWWAVRGSGEPKP